MQVIATKLIVVKWIKITNKLAIKNYDEGIVHQSCSTYDFRRRSLGDSNRTQQCFRKSCRHYRIRHIDTRQYLKIKTL